MRKREILTDRPAGDFNFCLLRPALMPIDASSLVLLSRFFPPQKVTLSKCVDSPFWRSRYAGGAQGSRDNLQHLLQFCHGCVLREQQRVAENDNGRIPKWLKCMTCREKTSFRPDEPKYHRLLIDLLGRAQQYTATKIKQEDQGDIVPQISADTDEANPSKASKADEQPSLALENCSPVLDNEYSNQHTAEHEELPPEKLHVRIKVEEPDDIDEQLSESKTENEFTADECMAHQALEDGEMNRSSLVNEQKNIIHLIELLQYRVRHSKVPQVFKTIDEISRQTELITPSIIVEFPLGDAIRSARKKFGDEYPEMKMKCKALSSEIRRIYEKEAENGVRNGKRTNEQAEHYEHNKLPRLALADDVHAGCFHTESTVDGYVDEAHSGDFGTELIKKEQDAREVDSRMPCEVDEVTKIALPDELLSGGFHAESIEKKQDALTERTQVEALRHGMPSHGEDGRPRRRGKSKARRSSKNRGPGRNRPRVVQERNRRKRKRQAAALIQGAVRRHQANN
ncbi:hypothetical protein THAOC_17659 [Thalassiosira oceanica]|uniref:Uncharacterized protein n=1 Tax=Thalassiosira oceanica TaxID=159749 RepID=K0SA35_THAOC|nr:hypothetical protein THAOC_17659 [Thalassiosira oceanica]|eukprot:EJK61789.1 hypothetical protein THAOC_17659 [Thalassiosira oceanica]